jgi:hypothetical protein
MTQATPALPQAKQCVTIGDQQFGSVAVYSDQLGRWGVMNPGITNPNSVGGHWADATDVASWSDLPVQTAVEPTPEPEPVPADQPVVTTEPAS